jgi:hypothetical protein
MISAEIGWSRRGVCNDSERLGRILAQLEDADDRAWVIAQLEPAWLSRRRRLEARDAAIRAARQFFPDERVTCAAKALARALTAYRASNWHAEKDSAALPATASGRHRALHGILRANGGASIGWRRIVDVMQRTGCSENSTDCNAPVAGCADAGTTKAIT